MNKKIAALILNAGLCGAIAVNPIASAYAAESYKAPAAAEETVSGNEISGEEYNTISAETGFSYEVKDGSIVFENISKSSSMMSFIISSNSDYDMIFERNESTFSPKADGRYVLTVVQMYETIFPVGKPENGGHVHYFYPVVTSYTVDASGKEINIDKKNSHNYYSEEQITKIQEGLADYEYIVCSDAEAEGSENLLNETYFSFVNGNLPDTSYITTYYYSKYTVESYFCINIRGTYGESCVQISDDTLASTMEKMNTSSSITADDIMDFYMVKALKDGKVTVNVGYQLMIDQVIDKPGYDHDLVVIENPGYDLVIENGIFKRADKKVSAVKGDANGDGELNISDVVMLQKWLLGAGDLTCWENVDLCKDGRIDVFDLRLLKQELINIGDIYRVKELYLCKFPEVSESNTFDFTSPDGSQRFYVRQNAEKYRDRDGCTTLDFYTNFDHYDLLKCLTIASSDMPYMPFNDNGKWSGSSFTDDKNFEIVWNESSVTFNFIADKEYSLTFDYVDTSLRNQTITQEINNKEKPEITAVELTADCAGGLKYRSKIKDVYRADVMTSGTVGLVGTPIEFTLDENVGSASAVFHYNEDELRWVKEEDLILMYYSNKAAVQAFREVDAVIDTEKNTVSFDVKNDGIYLLVDACEWSNYFGKDRTEFKKNANILAYTSDWERGYDTGDIMNLCDKEWAIANAPDFRVSTPEQLASVVWYVNASGFQCSVTLENDIDLAGYQWAPMGYQPISFVGNKFNGTIDGNGFAIKNMSISSDLSDVGFIGIGGSEIRNIRFENAYIKGGRNTGIVCGDSKAKFSNVSVSGNIETYKDNCIGAIVGYQASGSFVDCTADVAICGEPYPYFSYQNKAAAETEIKETYAISIDENCVLTRNDCGYTSLSWEFYVDGERILSRNAVKSTECNIKDIEFFKKYSGKECTVYLTTYRNGAYVRTSNILDFILP